MGSLGNMREKSGHSGPGEGGPERRPTMCPDFREGCEKGPPSNFPDFENAISPPLCADFCLALCQILSTCDSVSSSTTRGGRFYDVPMLWMSKLRHRKFQRHVQDW